ncbi:LexA/Signal peptidase [Polyplosphaeria fusca]|uniref:Mitochondrial inner membrane protease subunit n=1 Tax=Polyplosphaeria fusca TaxID=682080 RepID=A0A9P4V4U4_9PLEO|nr:LexA/Signal peptidase [Polyplosphaeria fusca]
MPPKPSARISLKPPPRIPRKPAQSRTPPSGPPSGSPAPRPFRSAWNIGKTLIFSTAVFYTLRDQFGSLDIVRGSSMAPTLSARAHETGQMDRIWIRRGLRTVQQVTRGDIVTFWKPHNPREIGIKRIVAVAGDKVYPKRGYAVEGNGGERLGIMDGIEEGREGKGVVVVPYGHVWVEGDNWRNSSDSNDFGPISQGLIEGKAVRVWRGWFRWYRKIEDKREKGKGARVVEGNGARLDPMFQD